jgi:VWFA-related protein
MFYRSPYLVIAALLASCSAMAQHSAPPYQMETVTAGSMIARSRDTGDLFAERNLWRLLGKEKQSPLEGPSGSVSAKDLKAPWKAKGEYRKGYTLYMRNDLPDAATHLEAALSIYPQFVAAHGALGSVYMRMGRNSQALDEFTKAISLDDHLPGSYMNLACAQLAVKDYDSAEESVRKATIRAPLDLELQAALAYVELMNRDYAGTIATAQSLHSPDQKKDVAILHYYAAIAWRRLNHLQETREELETFLQEDPSSKLAKQAEEMVGEIKAYQAQVAAQPQASQVPQESTPEQKEIQRQLKLQEAKEEGQIAEAEAADAACATCNAAAGHELTASLSPNDHQLMAEKAAPKNPFSLRSVVDEVAVLFAATDHGNPVTDLTRRDVKVLDDQKPPVRITDFRNEDALPLRLGVVIDTSESVTERFSFEQRAASHFLQDVLTKDADLAFVVGVSNSVLLVQDFTNDQQKLSHAVDQLAPGGGTALWDAVRFASHKLASREETQPVARLIVVISDGKDNSSQSTLKEAIQGAVRGNVFIYTVSATDDTALDHAPVEPSQSPVGKRALNLLAERTGGAAFAPRTLGGLDRGLDQVQRVIRSRYLISYKPARFETDGRYRTIQISVHKSGHDLRVYARKGYYARARSAPDND